VGERAACAKLIKVYKHKALKISHNGIYALSAAKDGLDFAASVRARLARFAVFFRRNNFFQNKMAARSKTDKCA
jgi:hypothetical protein